MADKKKLNLADNPDMFPRGRQDYSQEAGMNNEDFLTDFMAFIAQKGLSVTSQRKAIAEAFFSYPGHHTSEEFYQHISTTAPHIGHTTVYRTLKLLCAAGLASEIQFSDNIARYEVADPHKHHDHLICVECGKVEEVYDPEIESLQTGIAKKHGFILKGHSHNLYGICQKCQERGQSMEGLAEVDRD